VGLPTSSSAQKNSSVSTSVKKYKTGETIIFDNTKTQYMISPLSSTGDTKTVRYVKITADTPVTTDCYVSTVQKAQQGGKTSKSKKSKKRTTHKKK
jgi:hypothetical protein